MPDMYSNDKRYSSEYTERFPIVNHPTTKTPRGVSRVIQGSGYTISNQDNKNETKNHLKIFNAHGKMIEKSSISIDSQKSTPYTKDFDSVLQQKLAFGYCGEQSYETTNIYFSKNLLSLKDFVDPAKSLPEIQTMESGYSKKTKGNETFVHKSFDSYHPLPLINKRIGEIEKVYEKDFKKSLNSDVYTKNINRNEAFERLNSYSIGKKQVAGSAKDFNPTYLYYPTTMNTGITEQKDKYVQPNVQNQLSCPIKLKGNIDQSGYTEGNTNQIKEYYEVYFRWDLLVLTSIQYQIEGTLIEACKSLDYLEPIRNNHKLTKVEGIPKGSHALQYFMSGWIKIPKDKSVTFQKMTERLNSLLPPDLWVYDIKEMSYGFNSANRSTVIYEINIPTYCLESVVDSKKLDELIVAMTSAYLSKQPGRVDQVLNCTYEDMNSYRIDPHTLHSFKFFLYNCIGEHHFHNFSKGVLPGEGKMIIDFIEVQNLYISKGIEWARILFRGENFKPLMVQKLIGYAVLLSRTKANHALVRFSNFNDNTSEKYRIRSSDYKTSSDKKRALLINPYLDELEEKFEM
ncbi:hypothetical protein ROZALSC1DRAFT_26423 [Rozella allomycis CSF55]|uniref:Uncharacterized protein n=1 Tax=Rozella allomycis (strain CSF55) TaxID=988480 RepID=A0A4V1J0N5_ROZAC|nr:hypothetical protein ROZALSC1DRAFT_26423 [Rozella allomycis CSF55]